MCSPIARHNIFALVYVPQTSTILQREQTEKKFLNPLADQRQDAIVNGKYRYFAPS